MEVGEDERDLLIAELWDAGTIGVTELSGSVRAFFPDSVEPQWLRERFARFDPDVRQEEEQDWVEQFRAQWQPEAVGEQFYLVPEWRNDPAPCGRIRLWTYPGMACGTGSHPCTQLCLEAMEKYLPSHGTVLDVGTGTGILAQAAHLLGAEPVIACDIDPAASIIARQNFAKSPHILPVFTGSVRCVRSGSIECVIANINAAVLENSREELKRIATADAIWILSGFPSTESERVIPEGMAIRTKLERDGWMCLVLSAQA